MRPCEACSVARTLQPAMIVVEDVEDADVVFLLTTNRADLLEPALARTRGPGRPHRAARPRVAAPARRALPGGLDVDLTRLDAVLDRTDGVTASFLKELLRRAAVVAADRVATSEEDRLHVTADALDAALDDLLDTRNQMTRAVLGYRDG